jgi:hypothetical protein
MGRRDPPLPASVWEWKVPLALLLVGLTVLALGTTTAEASSGLAATLLGMAMILVLHVALTIGAMYLTARLLGVSFGLLKTAVLKLAAITVFTLSLNQVGDWLGQPLLGWLVAVAVSLYLFSYCFDLDFLETLLAVVVITVIRFALGIGMVMLLDLLTAAS